MHYKKKKTKSQAARCMCAMGKHNEYKDIPAYQTLQEQKALIGDAEQLDRLEDRWWAKVLGLSSY